ncbi:hypothetical protein TruAng_003215 [Truncatella angustata]|nr:hypothetical protein TruAng_003215 [Truncatella angustata]
MFSPMSSFVFYPAITSIAESLGTTVALVNIAITTYMLISGITPAILGDAADKLGRRPIYILALSIYFVANLGLALQSSYPALLVLRMIQSVGSSGYGIVSDIASPAERGLFVGIFSLGPNVAPPFGPVIGGLIVARLGWHSIFWFLAILGGLCLLLVVLALPETARKIVGSGTNKMPLSMISKHQSRARTEHINTTKPQFTFPNPLHCLKLLLFKDIFIVILCNGIYYATYCCVQASLSTLFIQVYGYGKLEAGLIYIPFGFGCLVSTYSWGKLLNSDYARTGKLHCIQAEKRPLDGDTGFPIEEARLRSAPWLIILAAVSITAYGWSVQYRAHASVPLIIQTLIGFSTTGMFVVLGTLLTDLNPDRSSTAAASANVVRCALAAGTLAVLQTILDNVGPGWCFTIFGLLNGTCGPLLFLELRKGKAWREARNN